MWIGLCLDYGRLFRRLVVDRMARLRFFLLSYLLEEGGGIVVCQNFYCVLSRFRLWRITGTIIFS